MNQFLAPDFADLREFFDGDPSSLERLTVWHLLGHLLIVDWLRIENDSHPRGVTAAL